MHGSHSFLFYDTETSGLNPAFDQILTFAAIRTDLGLNEISRDEILIRLRPDIVPSPGAFLTHRLTPEILAGGISEYDAAQKIHELLNSPGTISCGYNSLGFDDEFLRFLFYRNLLDPYTHQFAHGCSRADMLPVAVIYYLFCDGVISWPVLPDGKPTLKLEHLTRENRFETSGRAHEAMSDVESLIALSRKFCCEKSVWDYVLGFFDKGKEPGRILKLEDSFHAGDVALRTGLMVSASFGSAANYIAPVVYLGESVPYKNQSLWLRMDSEDLFSQFDTERNIYDLFVIRKRPGDQMFLLPCYDRFWGKVTPGAKSNYQQNLLKVRQNPDRFFNTVSYHRNFKYPEIPNLDADAALYQIGFFSSIEKKDIVRFRNLLQCGAYDSVLTLMSPRIRELALRILFRNFQENPVAREAGCLSHWGDLAGRPSDTPVVGYKNDTKLTCLQAQEELRRIDESKVQLDDIQRRILSWLKSLITEQSTSFAEPF